MKPDPAASGRLFIFPNKNTSPDDISRLVRHYDMLLFLYRQPPQGVQGSFASAATTTSAMRRLPSPITMAAIAPASAQVPSGKAAFSTLQPAKTAPSSVRSAAPTWKRE